jgi:hypothetical protein
MQVFLSHSSVDKPIARRLADELNSRNVRVWLDEAEIRVGQSIPAQVAEALESSDVICILVSKPSAASLWVKRELNSFLPRVIAGGAFVLPCRLDATPLPPLIADLKYADFTRSFDDGLSALLAGVALKEEIDFRASVAALKQLLMRQLTAGQITFFVHYFSRTDHFFSSSHPLGPYEALDTLAEHGVLKCEPDTHARYYYLTALGGAVRVAMQDLVSDATMRSLDKAWDEGRDLFGSEPTPAA